MIEDLSGKVIALARDDSHRFSKKPADFLTLIAGRGVEGDAHCGETVKHRSRVAVDPTQPNLRQVHLIQSELFNELSGKGFTVAPGEMGENITTIGINLLALPDGTRLAIGTDVVLELTGLRNPCAQIDNFQNGLLAAVLERTEDGRLIRKAGVMAIVITGGRITIADKIAVQLPPEPWRALERV